MYALVVGLVVAFSLPARADDVTRALAVNSQVDNRSSCSGVFQVAGCQWTTATERKGATWRHAFEASVAADTLTTLIARNNGGEEYGFPAIGGRDGAAWLGLGLGAVAWIVGRLGEEAGHDMRLWWGIGTFVRIGAITNNIYQISR